MKRTCSMRRPTVFLAVLAQLGLGGSASLMAAGKADFNAAALFDSSCAPCHGLSGEGDGPVVSALTVKPKPLTTLASRHNGVFPADYVYGVIDGRLAVKAHGSRQMPVWGDYFAAQHQGSAPGEAATELSTELKIKALVDYIASLQKK
jgi:mono/diheme cytochrome c family protein